MIQTNNPAIAYYPGLTFAANYSISWLISSNRYVSVAGRGNVPALENATVSIHQLDPPMRKILVPKSRQYQQ
jgi:hypothetical protein